MTYRMTMIALAAVLTACNGDKDGSDTNVVDTDVADTDDQDTADTAEPIFQPEYYTISALFAIDADNADQARAQTGFDNFGSELDIPVVFSITLADASVLTSGQLTATNSCTVEYSAATAPRNDSWATASSLWYGVEVPTSATVVSNCNTLNFPESWGADPTSQITKWRWGVGFGPLDAATRTQLQQQFTAAEWAQLEPHLFGGALFHSALLNVSEAPNGVFKGGYSVANALDTNWTWVLDGGQPELVLADEILLGDNLARAGYNVSSSLIGPAEQLLLQQP